MAEKRKLVIIEDGVLLTLAQSPVALAAFPFLRPLGQDRPSAQGCQRCRKKTTAAASVYAAAKAAIAGLDATRKQRLKDLLHAQSVRVIYSAPAGDPKNPTRRRQVILTF